MKTDSSQGDIGKQQDPIEQNGNGGGKASPRSPGRQAKKSEPRVKGGLGSSTWEPELHGSDFWFPALHTLALSRTPVMPGHLPGLAPNHLVCLNEGSMHVRYTCKYVHVCAKRSMCVHRNWEASELGLLDDLLFWHVCA